MNIKSLLFGSAAALVAVSGARAADAVVVAEPEPVEYVRVCDTYGVGFYYIPGTETCLRISGLIRYDIDYNDEPDTLTFVPATLTLAPEDDFSPNDGFDLSDNIPDLDDQNLDDINVIYTPGHFVVNNNGLDDGWAKTAVARLNIDARSETEWGTFRRFIRLQGSVKSGADTGTVSVIYAYIELGGFLVGLYDTLYDGDLSPEFDSGGGTPAHQIRYTWTGANGLSVAVSVEEQQYNVNYTPNFAARVAIAQAWGGVALYGAYDDATDEFGAKLIASFNATDAILLEMLATYETGAGDFSVGPANGNVGYEFSLAGAVSFKASDRITIRGGGQYFWNQAGSGADDYTVGGQVDVTLVENLLWRVQVQYNGGDTQDFVSAKSRLEAVF